MGFKELLKVQQVRKWCQNNSWSDLVRPISWYDSRTSEHVMMMTLLIKQHRVFTLWFCPQKKCTSPFPNEHASSARGATTSAGCRLKQVTYSVKLTLKWIRHPTRDITETAVVSECKWTLKLEICLILCRCDDKPGGRGDFLCIRPDAGSHERSPRVHQWDLQGRCECPPLVVAFLETSQLYSPYDSGMMHKTVRMNTPVFLFWVAARTAAGVWCCLHRHHHWDKVNWLNIMCAGKRHSCRVAGWKPIDQTLALKQLLTYFPTLLSGILVWWWNFIPTWVLSCYTIPNWTTNGSEHHPLHTTVCRCVCNYYSKAMSCVSSSFRSNIQVLWV